MYMSGRALFPLSINVAAVLSRALTATAHFYSGGASQLTIRDILIPLVFALSRWQTRPAETWWLSAAGVRMRELEGSAAAIRGL